VPAAITSQPANEKILRFLRNPYDFISGPKAEVFRQARLKDLAAGRVKESQSPEEASWLNLGTHPDVVERLWRGITVLLPEPCAWIVHGAPALVQPRTGVIFGWAGGSRDYALRLPEKAKELALKGGAKLEARYSTGDLLDVSELGEEWVLLNFSPGEERWCLESYDYAGTL
jgi:hypothetical protein